MTTLIRIDFQGAQVPNTPIEVKRLEATSDSPVVHVTVRLPVGGVPEEKRLKMDLDKRWFVDDVGDPTAQLFLQAAAEHVWTIVILALNAAAEAAAQQRKKDKDPGDGKGPKKGPKDPKKPPGSGGGNGKPGNGLPH